jgi:hypothetical protein
MSTDGSVLVPVELELDAGLRGMTIWTRRLRSRPPAVALEATGSR